MKKLLIDALRLRERDNIAEIQSDRSHWLVVSVMSGDESMVAAQLSGRGYGVFVPGNYNRGSWINLLPGYVFVLVFGIEHHRSRVLSCPGVQDFLYEIGHPSCPFVVPDRFIEELRRAERSDIEGHEDRSMAIAFGRPKRTRKRGRKSLRIRKRKNIVELAASA